ncbi:MAG: hypothetical protein Q9169_008726 [Polycauliona sp. 2 TL-2023]
MKDIFPFLQLPLEIRLMIYAMVLPFDDEMDIMTNTDIMFVLRLIPAWNRDRRIDLLLTNQQIYAETVPSLYSKLVCEVFSPRSADISSRSADIICKPSPRCHTVREGEEVTLPRHAIFIRHCELLTRFDPFFETGGPPDRRPHDLNEASSLQRSNTITDGIHDCVKALSTLQSPLRTLTFKLNCQRLTEFKSASEAVDFWMRIMEPFDQFHVSERWTVVMVGWWDTKCSCERDDCAEVERSLQEYFGKKVRARGV